MIPIAAPSPNFDERRRSPDMIVLHYTGMASGAEALARLRDPAAKVSAHFLVEEDGRVFALVEEARRAWHAGIAYWAGERDINGLSIGIEIVNPGHEFGYRDFPDVQVSALVDLLDAIRGRWPIPDRRILGHSDVAPTRKQDPGERFPWARLAAAGHGVWPAEALPTASPAPNELAAGSLAPEANRLLAAIGYETFPSRHPAAPDNVRAFRRHWTPRRIDGGIDAALVERMAAVLAAAGSPEGMREQSPRA